MPIGTLSRGGRGGREGAAAADLIGLIEACYVPRQSDESWLRGVLAAARPHLDRGSGLMGYFYDVGSAGIVKPSVVTLGPTSALKLGNVVVQLSRSLPRNTVAAYYRPARAISSASSAMKGAFARSPIRSFLAGIGSADAVNLVAMNPDGRGCSISAAAPARVTISSADRLTWTYVAAHIAAGMRLQRAPRAPVDAVLRGGGRVEHAEGAARAAPARESLERANRLIDHARGSLRRASPREAVALWHALVAGRWSLIEHFDSDGRRYLLARRNAPRLAMPDTALSHRQCQVLAYAALGHSNKVIGYELGISTSTVAVHLGAAATRLGSRTRLAAIHAFQQLQHEGHL
jgi:DNA-binding CsgD family transcriptional regulator